MTGLPQRYAPAVLSILLASGHEKAAPKVHGDGRLHFGRGELAAYGVVAAMKLATLVLNHIDEQANLTMDERYDEEVAPKRRATADRKKREQQRPKPSVRQLAQEALIETTAELEVVEAQLRAHDNYQSGARGGSCSGGCSVDDDDDDSGSSSGSDC